MGMKVNIENCLNNACKLIPNDNGGDFYKYSIKELVQNMKWLKQERSVEALDQFFGTYVFMEEEKS